MGLIIFHLVFSAFTFDGVDMSMAEKILNYNIKRYPNGAATHASELHRLS